MANGKMSSEEIVLAVQQLVNDAVRSGEKLTGTSIARRVGCGRTTLYTNSEVRSILLESGIIDDAPSPVKNSSEEVIDEPIVALAIEKKLQKVEDKANRLEVLLAEALEKNKAYEKEIESLRLRNNLLSQGKSII